MFVLRALRRRNRKDGDEEDRGNVPVVLGCVTLVIMAGTAVFFAWLFELGPFRPPPFSPLP
jgi:hypothetical protein